MTLDNLFNKRTVDVNNLIVDDLLKKDIVSFYSRSDYKSASYWRDKKSIMAKYRRQCAKHLTKEYGWPKYVAQKTASVVSIPSKNISIADYVAGYFAGSLPERYCKPVAKLMGTDWRFYTKINIVADVITLAASAYIINELKPDDLNFFSNAIDLTNQGISGFMLKVNLLLRTIQIPVRTGFYLAGKHTWSIATLINPNLLESILLAPLIGYDYYHKFNGLKQK